MGTIAAFAIGLFIGATLGFLLCAMMTISKGKDE
jgi:putative Ca2+/H+ antiporter (TMEM165/GDT1 family)